MNRQVSVTPPIFAILRSPWLSSLDDLIAEARHELLLVSPFIKRATMQDLLSKLRARRMERALHVHVITNIHLDSIVSGALDLEALSDLSAGVPNMALTHLPALHAKVYVADTRMVIITSANLTASGLSRNIEYGIASRDVDVVAEVRRDLEGYAALGADISATELAGLAEDIQELKTLYRRAQQTIQREDRAKFRRKLEATGDRVLRNRARGRTTQSILVDTILFALRRGPLRTAELQPLIQELQPDICDDSIDRVIDGVHFGKKWKHHVRSAQQALKRAGRVYFDGERWHEVGVDQVARDLPSGRN